MRTADRPNRCWIGWTADRSDFIHRAIMWITGPWAHVLIGLDYQSGRSVYGEALAGRGFVWPKNAERLAHWRARKPQHRKVRIEYLALEPDECALVERRLEKMSRSVTYCRKQILRHWFFERLGRWFGRPVRETADAVTCGEAVGRALEGIRDVRDNLRVNYDSVTPSSIAKKVDTWKTAGTLLALLSALHFASACNALCAAQEAPVTQDRRKGPAIVLQGSSVVLHSISDWRVNS